MVSHAFFGQPSYQLARMLSLSEHLEEYNDNDRTSGFADHLLDSGHSKDHSSIRLIHANTEGRLLNKLEELEVFIAFHRGNVILRDCIKFNTFYFLTPFGYISLMPLSPFSSPLPPSR